jgi:hypothetical protein
MALLHDERVARRKESPSRVSMLRTRTAKFQTFWNIFFQQPDQYPLAERPEDLLTPEIITES